MHQGGGLVQGYLNELVTHYIQTVHKSVRSSRNRRTNPREVLCCVDMTHEQTLMREDKMALTWVIATEKIPLKMSLFDRG